MLVRNYIELNECTGVAVVPPDCIVARVSRQDGGGAVHIVGLLESSKLVGFMNSRHTLFIEENVKLSAWNLHLVGAQTGMVCADGNPLCASF